MLPENLLGVSCKVFSLYLTSPFPILELQDQGIGEFYVDLERDATDFEAQKLLKGRSDILGLFLGPRQARGMQAENQSWERHTRPTYSSQFWSLKVNVPYPKTS